MEATPSSSKTTSLMPSWVPGLIASTMLMFMAAGAVTFWRSWSSRGWPVVEGRVTASSIESERDRDHHQKRSRTTYEARVTYTYTVDGKTYTSDRIRAMRTSSSRRASAQEDATKYPKGGMVKVHYRPDDPSYALLDTSFSWGSFAMFFGGLAIFMVTRVVRRHL